MLKKYFKRLFIQHHSRIDPYEVDNEFILKTDFPKHVTDEQKN
jgi:hypothetical protein